MRQSVGCFFGIASPPSNSNRSDPKSPKEEEEVQEEMVVVVEGEEFRIVYTRMINAWSS